MPAIANGELVTNGLARLRILFGIFQQLPLIKKVLPAALMIRIASIIPPVGKY